MIRFFIRVGIYLVSSAIGLLVASLVLDGVHVRASGFIVTVVIFALAQSLLTPWVFKVVRRNANAFVGGIGIVSALVALIVASLFGSALQIDGLGTWLLAAVIVWLAGAVASLLLPMVLVKAGVRQLRDGDRA